MVGLVLALLVASRLTMMVMCVVSGVRRLLLLARLLWRRLGCPRVSIPAMF